MEDSRKFVGAGVKLMGVEPSLCQRTGFSTLARISSLSVFIMTLSFSERFLPGIGRNLGIQIL
jgi:hypothetical protein